MSLYLTLKLIHILSSTLLFGTGIGTAFHMLATHLRGNVPAIASTTRNVVLADWLFIATSGVVQPLSGLGLVYLGGWDPQAPWLLATYGLFALAGLCWLIVVRLQLQMAVLAGDAIASDTLPSAYFHLMRLWFALGWPAFLALVAVFWLMVAKPELG
jgi:uncharacterized membrane protein